MNLCLRLRGNALGEHYVMHYVMHHVIHYVMHHVMHYVMQVPYLVDPNSGSEMFESDAIVDYLLESYGELRPCASHLNRYSRATALRPPLKPELLEPILESYGPAAAT